MNKIIFILTILLSNICFRSNAQDLNINWSEKLNYDNKLDGKLNYIIGCNSSTIFTKYSKFGFKEFKKQKIVAFDKKTLKKTADHELIGYNKQNDLAYAGLEYYRSVIFDDKYFLFWEKRSKDNPELYVECFDNNLKRLFPLKKAHEGKGRLIILNNNKAEEKIVICVETYERDTKRTTIKYKEYDKNFNQINANQFYLPKEENPETQYSSSEYDLGMDGNLYIKCRVYQSNQEKGFFKKKDKIVYSLLNHVNLREGKLSSFVMKFENKNVFDLDYRIEKNVVKIYAFFSDLEKDPKGRDVHGILFETLDNRNFKLQHQNFTYFEKSTLDKLFEKDQEDKKRAGGLFKSKKDKKSDEESIDSEFTIESVQSVDEEHIVIFASIMHNFTITRCTSSNGTSSCTSNPYCRKSNVTVFKLNSKGELIWASNLDRLITYSGTNIKDLNVIQHGKKYYAIYGNQFSKDAAKKNFFSAKTGNELRDKIEYAVFNDSDGSYSRFDYAINAKGEKEKKFVDPTQIEILDNQFYVKYNRFGVKPGLVFSCLFPPLYIYLKLTGNGEKGKGFIGRFTIGK